MTITFSKINDGQYEVEINLNDLMDDCHLCGFVKQLEEIHLYENEYAFVSSLKNGILKYKSETLLPNDSLKEDKRLLFVFGNPANHSIIHKMFFFSNTNGSKHRMWSKLDSANIISQISSEKVIPIDAREEEAIKRKEMILEGNQASPYLVGMTTFYSFPTSAEGGVKKVEELFASILHEVQKKETERILGYNFTDKSKIIFVQKSSYDAFLALVPKRKKGDVLFWPIRGKGSSGEELKNLLQNQIW